MTISEMDTPQPSDVLALLPHGPEVAFVSRVLASDAQSIWALAPVSRAAAFADAQGLPALYGLEILAQTAAAFFTLAAGGGAPRQGMLIACQSFSAAQPYFARTATLLARAELASALPAAEQGKGLVRFSGQLYLPEEAVLGTLPDSCAAAELSALAGAQTCEANFSVYI
ncbi:MAG: hypothetical protein AAF529_01890 [Pseudomonadota bacterium]